MTEEIKNFVPAWKIKADKLKEAVKQGLGKQVVFKSTDTNPCEPVLVSENMANNNYPFVVEEPVGFIAPKFEWNSNNGWIETANIEQGKELIQIKADVKALQDTAEVLKSTSETLKQNQDQAKTEKVINNKKIDQVIQLVTMTNMQVGKLMQLNAKNTTDTITSTTEGGKE